MGRMRADLAGDLVPCVGDRNKLHHDDRTGGAFPAKIGPCLRIPSAEAKELCPCRSGPYKASTKTFH